MKVDVSKNYMRLKMILMLFVRLLSLFWTMEKPKEFFRLRLIP